jgi:hypothetical protein
MKLTACLHPVLSLRMCGATPPLLIHLCVVVQINHRDGFTFMFVILVIHYKTVKDGD